MLFTYCLSAQQSYNISKGKVHIESWDTKENVNINGTWELYLGRFISPDADFTNYDSLKTWTQKSGIWSYQDGGRLDTKSRFATLRAVLYGRNLPKNMGIYIRKINSAYELYINNRKVARNGVLAKKPENFSPDLTERHFLFSPTSDTLTIVIHVADFMFRQAGILHPLTIGTKKNIMEEHWYVSGRDSFLMGAFFIMGFYHLLLLIIVRRDWVNLWFALICFLMTVRIFVVSNHYLDVSQNNILPYIVNRISHITVSIPLAIYAMYLLSIFKEFISLKAIGIISFLCMLHVALVIGFPVRTYQLYLPVIQIIVVLSMIYFGYVIYISRKSYPREFIALISSFAILYVALVNDILHNNQIIDTTYVIGFGMLFFIFSQSIMLSLRFADAFAKIRELSETLQHTNKELEQKVAQRTKKLNHMLSLSQYQKQEIESKNNDITASINYAQRIQQAMLSSTEIFESNFSEYFILYQPRDIVSGDFYRIYSKENHIVIIAADCTGHGIPGAFMSLIGSSLLDKIIIDQGILTPECILNELDTHIQNTLQQETTHNADGMDMSICVINQLTRELMFSGAKNPLILIQNNELKLVRGARRSIGGHRVYQDTPFVKHCFKLASNDQFYIFSDGYQDQFGGQEGRKFMSKNFRKLLYDNKDLTLEAQRKQLHQSLENWMKIGNEKQNDDILVIGVRPFSSSN